MRKMSCTTRCSRWASAPRAWFRSGSDIAGFSPMMYMPLISSLCTASMISTTVFPRFGSSFLPQAFSYFGDLLRVLHRLVVGEEHRDEPGVGGALHVVLAAQRMQAGAGAADLAADQRQRDQTARIVGAVGVLRDAHAPEDDGAFGARVGARHFAQRVGGNAADRRHLLRREVLDALGEGREAFDVSLHVLLVVEFLGDDDVEHGVEHRHVGAVLELHHLPGVALERLPARVHDDELGAALGRLLEEGGGDRVVLGRVGADHDDEIGILALVEGRGHRRRADAFQAAPPPRRRGTAACSDRHCWSRSRCAPASGTGRPLRSSPWPSRSRRARAGRRGRGFSSGPKRRAPSPRPRWLRGNA